LSCREKALNKKEIQRLAKFLAYVLGVRPDEFGLVPDPDGFVWLKELLQAVREEEEWRFVGQAHLNELLHAGFREELEILGDRLRWKRPKADLTPRPAGELPPRLYCAVRPRAHPVVLEKGLKPFKGPWVVLARTQELALRIGSRKDPNPVLIQVKTKEAAGRNIRFFATQGELFLVEELPADLLEGPPVTQKQRERLAPKPSSPKPTEPLTPGSFYLDFTQQAVGAKQASRRKDKDPAWKRERRRGRKD
jgi:putative RNA 2'-phosphotransferase